MKNKSILASCLIATLSSALLAQPSPAQSALSADKLNGIWRCQMNGLPAMTLTLTNEGGNLTGAVLFYLHRSEPGQPETATPGVPEPLFHPSFDGKTLTFQVSHRRAHPPGSLNDAPVTFDLRLDGLDRAELFNASENDPNAPKYVLSRTAY
jgi:hypothetical protein